MSDDVPIENVKNVSKPKTAERRRFLKYTAAAVVVAAAAEEDTPHHRHTDFLNVDFAALAPMILDGLRPSCVRLDIPMNDPPSHCPFGLVISQCVVAPPQLP